MADEISANNQAGVSTRLILPVGPVMCPLLVRICNKEQIIRRPVTAFNMHEHCDWQDGALHRLAIRIACLREVNVDNPVTLLQYHLDYLLFADEETVAPRTPNLGL